MTTKVLSTKICVAKINNQFWKKYSYNNYYSYINIARVTRIAEVVVVHFIKYTATSKRHSNDSACGI